MTDPVELTGLHLEKQSDRSLVTCRLSSYSIVEKAWKQIEKGETKPARLALSSANRASWLQLYVYQIVESI